MPSRQGVKHLTDADRQRVRTLYFDAGLSPMQINKITGFTLGQIKRARDNLHVGKRTGRPKVTQPVDDGKEATRAKFKAVRRPKVPRPPAPAPAPNWEQSMMAMQGAQQPSVMPVPQPQWNPQPAATPSATPLPITLPQSPATPQFSASPRVSATPQPSQSVATPQTGPQPGRVETPLLPSHLPLVKPIDPLKTVVLITGANRGIGFEVVKALLRAEPAEEDSPSGGPYHVFLCSRDWAKGDAAAASLVTEHDNSFTVLPLDVTNTESVKWAVETIDSVAGRVDILINNAAVMRYNGNPVPMLREALETNLVSAYAISEAFKSLLMVQLPASKKDKRLLHMTCDLGSVTRRSDSSDQSHPITAPEYRISKAGLNMLAACQAFELQGSGVKIGVYNAGYTATGLAGLDPTVKKSHGARDPADVAEAFVRVIEGQRDDEFGQILDTLEGTVPW